MAGWQLAPLGTPLWELLPRDLQEHIARFLKQKMLAQFCKIHKYASPRTRDEHRHLWELESMMQATPIFDRALYTVYLLSVPVQRWQHHHAFANGLVRFAWEAYDARLAKVQGSSHISVPWDGRADQQRLEVSLFQQCMLHTLRDVAHRAYSMSGSHYLPEHYLVEVCVAIGQGVHKGTLGWLHGYRRQMVSHFLQTVVNAKWHGRTKKQEADVRRRIKTAMLDAIQITPPGAQHG